MSVILRVADHYLLPLLLIFSFFLLARGHNAPGGGFAGGLVAAAAFAVYAVVYGVDATQRLLRIPVRTLMPLGLTVALVSGGVGLLSNQPFLTGAWWDQVLPAIGKLGTPFTFDIGVYLVVLGVVLTILFALMEQ